MLSASRTARARSFYTHERTRTTKSTVVEHSYHKSIGGGCRRSWRRASRLGQPLSLLICSQDTSSRSLFAGHWPVSALPSKRRARLNTCHSRPVRARCTRCRCFYVYVLVSLSHHKTTFHNVSVYFLKPLGSGQPYVICQDKTHLEEFRLRMGIGARCVRAEGSRSLA